jgi:hypothetical protein
MSLSGSDIDENGEDNECIPVMVDAAAGFQQRQQGGARGIRGLQPKAQQQEKKKHAFRRTHRAGKKHKQRRDRQRAEQETLLDTIQVPGSAAAAALEGAHRAAVHAAQKHTGQPASRTVVPTRGPGPAPPRSVTLRPRKALPQPKCKNEKTKNDQTKNEQAQNRREDPLNLAGLHGEDSARRIHRD